MAGAPILRARLHAVLAIGLLPTLLLLAAGSATAKTAFSVKVAAYCKSYDSCAICHGRPFEKATVEDLNVFGREFRKALLKAQSEKADDPVIAALKAVADGDADRDGVTNLEEISLGSNPGEADSQPDSKKLAGYRQTHAAQ